MLIDFHTHIFPDALAEKTIPKLAAAAGIEPKAQATLSDTREKMKIWGVDKVVMLSISTNERQMRKVNDFAAECNSEDVVAFGSVYPKCDSAMDELDRIKALGLKGVKFHPEYQGYRVDDEEVFPLYEKCEKSGLIMSFHAGIDDGFPDSRMATPEALARVADAFSSAKLVFAHMGAYRQCDGVLEHLAGKNVYFDTAMVWNTLPRERAAELIRVHSADKILFGTDLPWGAAPDAVRYIESLGLSEAEKEKIFHRNAEKLLGERTL